MKEFIVIVERSSRMALNIVANSYDEAEAVALDTDFEKEWMIDDDYKVVESIQGI
jgi:hypothetical protein